jgi:anti-sigma regulatory factor (Ser/Thr protein kinase)
MGTFFSAMAGASRTALHETYDAVPESVRVARNAIVGFAASAGVANGRLPDVWLAASESLTNVVKHAYRDGTVGKIEVDVAAVDHELTIVVADDGRGLRAHGRRGGLGLGLMLIVSVCDELVISNRGTGGTQVVMTFRFESGPPSRPGGPQSRGSVRAATAPARSRFSTTT